MDVLHSSVRVSVPEVLFSPPCTSNKVFRTLTVSLDEYGLPRSEARLDTQSWERVLVPGTLWTFQGGKKPFVRRNKGRNTEGRNTPTSVGVCLRSHKFLCIDENKRSDEMTLRMSVHSRLRVFFGQSIRTLLILSPTNSVDGFQCVRLLSFTTQNLV